MDFDQSFSEEIIFDSNSVICDNNFDIDTLNDLTSSKYLFKNEEKYEDIVYDHITELKIQQLDIHLPIVSLKSLLVANNIIDYSCSNVEYWLQGVEKCEGQTTFDTYCVKMKGFVQINLEVKINLKTSSAHINIIDILVPCDKDGVVDNPMLPSPKKKLKRDGKHPMSSWVIDKEFQLIRSQHGFSTELLSWTTENVRLWLLWAQKHFLLNSLDLDNLRITGSEVNDWKLEEIQILAPYDKELLFWTHFQLLKKFKIIAVKIPKGKLDSNKGNKSGNNGQIQLWQFLLEILIDQDCIKIVQWIGSDGEFFLKEPESVARMWGMRKNRCGMTYEKMSRAMRYYYDGEVIRKVPHKRFHYKFVCDLQSKIGMSVSEIQALTLNSKVNSKNYNSADHLRLNQLMEALRSPVCSKRAEPLPIAPLNYNSNHIKLEEVADSQYDL